MKTYAPLTLVDPPVVLSPDRHVSARREGTIAIWDVDGTLVRGDTLLPFLRRFTGGPRLARELATAMIRQPDRPAAKAALLQRVLGGRELGAVDAEARAFVLDSVLRRLRPDCLRRWQWHRAQGHRLVLASASLDLYLQYLGRSLGAQDVLCTGMEVLNGRLTGRMSTPNCRGDQKADRVRDYLATHPAGTVWAYGNSRADEAMLAMSDVPVRISSFRTLQRAGR